VASVRRAGGTGTRDTVEGARSPHIYYFLPVVVTRSLTLRNAKTFLGRLQRIEGRRRIRLSEAIRQEVLVMTVAENVETLPRTRGTNYEVARFNVLHTGCRTR